jgi:hypothetical protein
LNDQATGTPHPLHCYPGVPTPITGLAAVSTNETSPFEHLHARRSRAWGGEDAATAFNLTLERRSCVVRNGRSYCRFLINGETASVLLLINAVTSASWFIPAMRAGLDILREFGVSIRQARPPVNVHLGALIRCNVRLRGAKGAARGSEGSCFMPTGQSSDSPGLCNKAAKFRPFREYPGRAHRRSRRTRKFSRWTGEGRDGRGITLRDLFAEIPSVAISGQCRSRRKRPLPSRS